MRWEYKSLSNDEFVSEDMLNELGQEGWELVHYHPGFAWFKRPVECEHEYPKPEISNTSEIAKLEQEMNARFGVANWKAEVQVFVVTKKCPRWHSLTCNQRGYLAALKSALSRK